MEKLTTLLLVEDLRVSASTHFFSTEIITVQYWSLIILSCFALIVHFCSQLSQLNDCLSDFIMNNYDFIASTNPIHSMSNKNLGGHYSFTGTGYDGQQYFVLVLHTRDL